MKIYYRIIKFKVLIDPVAISLYKFLVSDSTISPVYQESLSPSPQKKKVNFIPLQYKLNVLAVVREHPKWNLKTLQTYGCSKLVRMDELTKWKKHVIAGGTRYDKLHAINDFVYKQFLEARAENRPVSTRTLQEWALQKSQHFLDFEFSASQPWVDNFKKKTSDSTASNNALYKTQ